MATIYTDTRNADNAHAWGDEESDVWFIRRTIGQNLALPRTSAALEQFAKEHLPLGWLSDDGVPIKVDTDSKEFTAFQGAQDIKSKITKTTRTFTVQCYEEIVRVTELFWGHGKPQLVAEGSGESVVDLPASLKTISGGAILRFTDEDFVKIYVFPQVQITDRGSVDHKNDALTAYEMTFKVSGKGWLITNSPDYAKNAEGTDSAADGNGFYALPVDGVITPGTPATTPAETPAVPAGNA